jgi:hypothetical protein
MRSATLAGSSRDTVARCRDWVVVPIGCVSSSSLACRFEAKRSAENRDAPRGSRASRWIRWVRPMNGEGVSLRPGRARRRTERLCPSQNVPAFSGATVWSTVTLWRVPPHVPVAGASPWSAARLWRGKSAAGVTEGKASSEPSLPAFQSVGGEPRGGLAIVGATSCFAERGHVSQSEAMFRRDAPGSGTCLSPWKREAMRFSGSSRS